MKRLGLVGPLDIKQYWSIKHLSLVDILDVKNYRSRKKLRFGLTVSY